MTSFLFQQRKVSYQISGPADSDRDPIILVSGLGGTMGFWHPVLDALAAQHRVVLFDHPGMGSSESPIAQTTVDMLSQLCLALLEHLHIKRAVFVGHSMGGIISQTVAVTEPSRVSAVVLSSTWMQADHYFRMAFEQRRLLLESGGPIAYARAQTLSVMPPAFIAENPQRADAQIERTANSIQNPRVVVDRMQALLNFDGAQNLQHIRQPVLVVYSDDDSVVPPHMSRRLMAGLVNASAVCELALRSGGHFAPSVLPARYSAGLLDFLAPLQ